MHDGLQQLYEAAAGEMFFCIGLVQPTGEQPEPFIQILFPHWSRMQLEVVRETLADGLIVTSVDRSLRPRRVHLATCQRVSISLQRDG